MLTAEHRREVRKRHRALETARRKAEEAKRELVRAIVEAHGDGASYAKIADEIGVSKQYVITLSNEARP